jgi:hypothetical protein
MLATFGLLFALLVSFKTFSYLATLWPLFALVIAAGFWQVWQAHRPYRWWRPLLAGLVLLAVAEGVLTTGRVQIEARQMTPYRSFTQRVAEQLPAQSQVLGLQHYWLGLAEVSPGYRSILVPIFWTSDKYVPQPVLFGQTAEAIPPTILLLDQIMLDFLAETASPTNALYPLNQEIEAYLQAKQARLIGTVNDPTYGRLEIYQLQDRSTD